MRPTIITSYPRENLVNGTFLFSYRLNVFDALQRNVTIEEFESWNLPKRLFEQRQCTKYKLTLIELFIDFESSLNLTEFGNDLNSFLNVFSQLYLEKYHKNEKSQILQTKYVYSAENSSLLEREELVDFRFNNPLENFSGISMLLKHSKRKIIGCKIYDRRRETSVMFQNPSLNRLELTLHLVYCKIPMHTETLISFLGEVL